MSNQISIFDKPKVKLIEDCTSLHPLLKENSIHEVYLDKQEYYIIYLYGVFYGIYKYKAEKY